MSKKSFKKPKLAEVVSIVAHQLKNPLSVIRGYLEVLLAEDFGKINKKQKEYLEDIFENTKKMLKIVSYLLDVSKIEKGEYRLKLEKFSLEGLIKEIIKELSLWIRASNSEISFKAEENLPKVLSEPFKIRQVIENLISNSIKFKGRGRGLIEISLKKKGNFVLFFCKDNGVGIPKKDFKKVFSKFYRSEKSLQLDPSGTGLGLYINKAIIELSGGKIWFKENKGKGVTFCFTLPISK